MSEAHTGSVALEHAFREVYDWLFEHGPLDLKTDKKGTPFQAIADVGKRPPRAGQDVIRFMRRGREYARAYPCCWGWYHNCHGTRIGMYCTVLDVAAGRLPDSKLSAPLTGVARSTSGGSAGATVTHTDRISPQAFPRLMSRYRWDQYHAAFGRPPDCLDTGFPWLVSLEDRFRNAIEQNGFPPLSLVTEMILWGGNQQNVLGKFAKGLRTMGYETFIRRVVSNLDEPTVALEAATAIKGFGMTYGSKLLRFCRPREFGALDSRIRKALSNELGAASSYLPTMQRQYKTFLEMLHEYQQRLHANEVMRPGYGSRAASTEWMAAEVEMALFAWASSKS